MTTDCVLDILPLYLFVALLTVDECGASQPDVLRKCHLLVDLALLNLPLLILALGPISNLYSDPVPRYHYPIPPSSHLISTVLPLQDRSHTQSLIHTPTFFFPYAKAPRGLLPTLYCTNQLFDLR